MTASGGTQGGSCGGGEPAANHSVVTSDNAAPGTCSCRSAAHADSPGATWARTGREENEAASVVGEDEFGNRYYRTRGGKIDPTLGFERRWVIYNGYAEASTVPPSWHGWMHHTVDMPPTEENYQPRAWQKPHRPT